MKTCFCKIPKTVEDITQAIDNASLQSSSLLISHKKIKTDCFTSCTQSLFASKKSLEGKKSVEVDSAKAMVTERGQAGPVVVKSKLSQVDNTRQFLELLKNKDRNRVLRRFGQ